MTLSRAKNLIHKDAITILETIKDSPDVKRQALWSNARKKIFDDYYKADED